MSATNTAYLLLGSNISPETNLPAAIERLRALGSIKAVSNVYESEAVKSTAVSIFLNAAVILETTRPVRGLKKGLSRIETELRRQRSGNMNDLISIDLDIMLWNDEVVTLGNRTIPDSNILTHAFAAVPLAEVAPNYVHPTTKTTLREIAGSIGDVLSIRLRPDVLLSSTLD